MDMPVKAALTVEEMVKFYADELGKDGALPSPETGRPYVKVATKGEGALYVNLSTAGGLYHPPVGEGGNGLNIPAYYVVIRFFQKGGKLNDFIPPLTARATVTPDGQLRLSKHTFPVCSANLDLAESWEHQGVGSQIVDWLKGICQFAQAKPMSDALLKAVVALAVPSKAVDSNPMFSEFFTLESKTDENESGSSETPEETDKEDTDTF